MGSPAWVQAPVFAPRHPGPRWPWVLGPRQAGLLTERGCLSGRAARAGDREDGVDHDTINLII